MSFGRPGSVSVFVLGSVSVRTPLNSVSTFNFTRAWASPFSFPILFPLPLPFPFSVSNFLLQFPSPFLFPFRFPSFSSCFFSRHLLPFSSPFSSLLPFPFSFFMMVCDSIKRHAERHQFFVEAYLLRVPALPALRQRGLHAGKSRAEPVKAARPAGVRDFPDMLRLHHRAGTYVTDFFLF